MGNLIAVGQTVQTYMYVQRIGHLTSCLSRSLKVIGTDTDRSATMAIMALSRKCRRDFPH